MARKTKEETDKTRARILAAAADVFTRVGYEGAALSDIGREAGVPKSLIHHHFTSKQVLWDAVRMQSFAGYAAEQLATLSTATSGLEFVRQTCSAYFRFLEEHPTFVRLLF